MHRIKKALKKLSSDEHRKLKLILLNIQNKDFQYLDIKKLRNRDDIYRVRKGKIRIIFRYVNDSIYILSVERRSDTTYK